MLHDCANKFFRCFSYYMQITPVTSLKFNNHYTQRNKSPNFTAHPDFYGFNSVQSAFFRRGAVVLPCNGYADIEKTFKSVIEDYANKVVNMLIIGIGRSQEPFSYSASFKSILKDKPLKRSLDLYTVDLQSKPDDKTLWQNSFYDGYYRDKRMPKFAVDSFVEDKMFKHDIPEEPPKEPIRIFTQILQKNNEPQKEDLYYRVNDEIFDFIKETYNNPLKSKWESPVQDAITDYTDNKFDIVSANNVLGYIINEEKIINTIKQIKRILKPNGYFITDPYDPPYWLKSSGAFDSMEQVYAGIYKKVGNK